MIQTFQTQLVEKQQLTKDVLFLKFDLDEPKEIQFVPGQYLIMFVPKDNDHVRRQYSIASSPSQNHSVELLIKLIPGGVASGYVEKLTVGEIVRFDGPGGRFVLNGNQKHKVFLATGTGIAPMRSILKSIFDQQYTSLIPSVILSEAESDSAKSKDPSRMREISSPRDSSGPLAHQNDNDPLSPTAAYTLYWGLPTYQDVYFFDELKQWAEKHTHFAFTICLSREQSLDMIPESDRKYFALGRITTALEPLIQKFHSVKLVEPVKSVELADTNTSLTNLTNSTNLTLTDYDFYICGNREVVESLRTHLCDKKIPPTCVIFEKF